MGIALVKQSEDQVLFAIILLLATAAMSQVPKIWTHRIHYFDQKPTWWVWGLPSWYAYCRAMIPGIVAMWLMSMFGLLYSFIGNYRDNEEIPIWTGVPLIVVLSSWIVTLTTITLFNWPKFVVPPHLRDQPGALREWQDAWRKRRST